MLLAELWTFRVYFLRALYSVFAYNFRRLNKSLSLLCEEMFEERNQNENFVTTWDIFECLSNFAPVS